MREHRHNLWGEKFDAKLDDDIAAVAGLESQLANHLPLMRAEKSRRRRYRDTLRSAAADANYTYQGGTAPTSASTTIPRTSTVPSTSPQASRPPAMATSFPGSVPRSAPQSSYAWAASASTRHQAQTNLHSLQAEIDSIYRDPNISAQERTGLIKSACDRSTSQANTGAVTSGYRSNNYWQDPIVSSLPMTTCV
jgi:hypothetical protein